MHITLHKVLVGIAVGGMVVAVATARMHGQAGTPTPGWSAGYHDDAVAQSPCLPWATDAVTPFVTGETVRAWYHCANGTDMVRTFPNWLQGVVVNGRVR